MIMESIATIFTQYGGVGVALKRKTFKHWQVDCIFDFTRDNAHTSHSQSFMRGRRKKVSQAQEK